MSAEYLSQTNNAVETAPALYSALLEGHNERRMEGQGPPPDVANLFSSIDIPQNLGNITGASTGSEGYTKTSTSVQEKNRRAQKRFRERQKARMQDMNEQLKLISDELSRLNAENSNLMNRNNILEKVLCLRDDHIRFLQDEQRVFDLGNHYHKSAALLQEPVDINSLDSSDEEVATEEDLAAKLSDPAMLKSMTGASVVAYWRKLVRELGVLLVNYDNMPANDSEGRQDAIAKLSAALDQGGQVCMQTAVLHPTNLQFLIASTLDGGRSGVSADDKSFWTSVVDSMQLDNEQECQIVALKDIFITRIEKIMAARQKSLEKLRSVAARDRLDALQSVISETLKVKDATQELKSNMQEEHLCAVEFLGTIFKTILTPLQKARCIVQSYPFYPDVYQIASIVAEVQKNKAPTQPDSDTPPPIDGEKPSSSVEHGPVSKMLKSFSK